MSDKRSLSSYDTGNTVRRPMQQVSKAPGSVQGGSTKSGPSLMGLLSSRRFVNKLKDRKKRHTDNASSTAFVAKEPTYRMDPVRKFNAQEVQTALEEFIDDRLNGYHYIPKFGKNFAAVLTEEVKDRIKCLNYDRYKIVCSVILGEIRNQDAIVTSRCTWRPETDSSANYTYKTKNYFCNVSVFGLYAE